ncbi:zinc-dependent alcohol dehydrogenase [Flavisphingomonas formosensis]|uniref:zinc-dependent alcohol dehydrogenase n=1 Tax=Flavisphingomonas formosensis TaxID=861534 RepID=UPI0012F87957|nr:zinc-binding dehydrogenase [Sphingomonas formosensis]
MRAAVFRQAGSPLTIENIEDPAPASDQVIIEVAHAGICGSDLHVTEYGFVPDGTVLGHEFAGTVVALGSGIGSDIKLGDRVTALPVHACQSCEACDAGLPALCSAALFTGTALNHRGAYADYVAARGSLIQKLPDGVSFAEGAMVEPLSVAYHAVSLAPVHRGAAVLVIGAGPIGAGATLFARMQGARHVIVSERSAERRALALECGATAVIDPQTEDVAARFAAIAGKRPEIVFECVGLPGLLQQAIEFAGTRGRVIVAGVCFGEDTLKPITGLMKEVSLQFSQCYTESDFAAVIDAIARGEARPQPMHSRTVSFAELPEAFEGLRNNPRACKVLIDPKRG